VVRTSIEYMEMINLLSNLIRNLDQPEREVIKMEIMFLEFQSFGDIEDYVLSKILEDFRLDLSKDQLTINRHRGILRGIRWVVEGR
jgi:hypothetical protein